MKDNTVQHPRIRISLKAILVTMAFVAMGCALVTQQFRLSRANASLSRYEDSIIPTTLESGYFRIIPRVVIDSGSCKVITYRVESGSRHTATVRGGGGSNGSGSNFDAKSGLHFSEVAVLIDHTKSKNSLKVIPKVGGAQGCAVMSVPDDFSLNDAVALHRENGVYKRSEDIVLFRLEDLTYALEIKP